ncbi:MAG: hypothetical protein AAGH65_00085 [Pseudomonadota bacterium]
MNTPDQDPRLQAKIVEQLEAERSRLDPMLNQQLDRIRRQAQATDEPSARPLSPWPWLATAATISLAVIVAIGLNQPGAIEPPASLDLDVLTMTEFELLDQDPAFMAWLAEQDTVAAGEASNAGAGGSST